ncbi:MAG: hypothetical protein ACNA8H_05950 [Anaerolineales bacterium]
MVDEENLLNLIIPLDVRNRRLSTLSGGFLVDVGWWQRFYLG